MNGKITAALEQWLAEGCNRIGEILVLKKSGGFLLVHHADRESAGGLEVFTKPEDARAISQYDAKGEYRLLKTAPDLKRGWALRLPDAGAVHAALDFFYPAMIGVLFAHREGKLKPVHFRETAARQTGMYDVVKKISNAQADILIGDFCKSDGKCIKTILWKLDSETPVTKLPVDKFDPLADQLHCGGQSIPLLCSEACNLLVAAARDVVRKTGRRRMIYRARAIVTMDGPPIENGAVAVQGRRDPGASANTTRSHRLFHDETDGPRRAGAPPRADQRPLPSRLHHDAPRDQPAEKLRGMDQEHQRPKRSLDDEDYLQAIARGFAESKKWGATTVLNIETFPELILKMPAAADSHMVVLRDDRHPPPHHHGGAGRRARSPFSSSARNGSAASASARTRPTPLRSTFTGWPANARASPACRSPPHLAESAEEDEMFRNARGPLYDFLASLGRDMGDCGKKSAFANLADENFTGPDWLLVHLNEMGDDDFALIAGRELGPEMHVVHCPLSHRYFSHKKFQFKRLHDLGVNISLGTDSLASNDSLDLFAEMREVQGNEPWLSAEEAAENRHRESRTRIEEGDRARENRPRRVCRFDRAAIFRHRSKPCMRKS